MHAPKPYELDPNLGGHNTWREAFAQLMLHDLGETDAKAKNLEPAVGRWTSRRAWLETGDQSLGAKFNSFLGAFSAKRRRPRVPL